MPRLVVILSVYHNDTIIKLRKAVDSLLRQSFGGFDIYIQEDGPVEIEIHKYLSVLLKNSVISYHGVRTINKGLAFSLNEMIRIALDNGYEYIARMDADDICHNDRLFKQIKYMDQHLNVDVIGSWIREMNMDTAKLKVVKYPEKHVDIVSFFAKRSPIAHVSAFFRRTYFQKSGLYREDTVKNEDLALWIDGVSSGCVLHNIQDVLVDVSVSDEFYDRRGGICKAYNDFVLKIEATQKFSFGMTGYMYAVGSFLIILSPNFIRKFAYRVMR